MIDARGSQRGVGLVEILIAVVLISIGFLAAARMQVQSMRFSQSAYFESQANFLAMDMIDRIRSNTDGVSGGAYDALSTANAIADPECAAKACASDQRALQDTFDWRAHFVPTVAGADPLLPATGEDPAFGTVTHLGDGRFQVSVNWGEIVDGVDETQSLSIFFVAETNR